MEYPFPPPLGSPLHVGVVLVLLLGLGCVPLVRMVTRHRRPVANTRWSDAVVVDRVLAGVCVLLALGAYWSLPRGAGALATPSGMQTVALVTAIIVLQLCWLLLVTPPGTRVGRRIIEAIVPYGVGGTLFFMLYGVYQAQEAAKRTQCRGHFKYIGLALYNFHDANDALPALVTVDSDPPQSWRVELLPYVDRADLRKQYIDTAAWDAAENRPVTQSLEVRNLYSCPSNPQPMDDQHRLYSAYFGVRGPDTLFPDGRGRKLREVTDGTSNTLAIVEACGLPVVWTEPRDVDLSVQEVGINLPGHQPGQSRGVISSFHHAGGHVGVADGSVRFVSDKIDPAVLRALLTATGGEPPPAW